MENMPVVNLGHARKAFGSNEVLKDISLTVNQGDVLSIIGPSGGGKSTLLRCMTLLETLDAGSLAYGDVKVAEADSTGKAVYGGKDVLAQAKKRYGLVFQNFNLFPHFTVLQNVTDALIASFPVVSSSVLPLPVLWRLTPMCCSSMNPRLRSTQNLRKRSCALFVSLPTST